MNFIILAFLLFSPLFLIETLAGSNCRCGEEGGSGPQDYIYGGGEVDKPNQYPWMALLIITKVVGGELDTYQCGGTLVASKYIITAAHCVVGDEGVVRESDIKVRIGEHNLRQWQEGPLAELDLQVKKLVVHPHHTHDRNDVAILYLAQEVDLATYTPACLPGNDHKETAYDGKKALALGWGKGGGDVLKKVKLTVVDERTCQAALRRPITPDMICAGGVKGEDTCQGDSGGPLTYNQNGQHILIGDTSFGRGCGLAGKYGVYGRISYFRSWIEKEMNKLEAPSYCRSGSEAGY